MDNSSQFFETDPFLTLNSPLRSSSKQSDAYDNLKETQGQIQKQINAWAELKYFFIHTAKSSIKSNNSLSLLLLMKSWKEWL